MLPLLPLIAAGAVGSATFSFHFMKVKEVFPGSEAAPNAQYVLLQMYAPGQNEVAGMQLRVYDAKGTLASTFTFPGPVPNGAGQSTILIATPEALAFFAPLTADLTMTAVLPRLGGKVCFFDPMFGLNEIDCAAWGGYSGAPAHVGPAFNVPVGMVRGLAMRRRTDICGAPNVLDDCDDTADSANDFRAVVPTPVNNAGQAGTIPPSVCGNGLVQSLEQCDDGNVVGGDGCAAACLKETVAAVPAGLVVDPPALAEGNGVFEPGEEVAILPSWRNTTTAPLTFGGTVSIVSGPAGATYNATDPNSLYGTVAPGASASCLATGNCLVVTVSNPSPRPVTHWDATVSEVMNTNGFKNWSVHLGNSFTDVPDSNPFYRFIEILLHRGVTGGCTATTFCPTNTTTRAAMAVFVLVSKEGPAYTPPACGSPVFADVPANDPFCRWIEELARRGVASGCGGGNYCPGAPVTREQMSVFVLRTLDPALNPPNCVAGSEMFDDVPAGNGFCRWIEELARRGVVTGCGGGNYCPTAEVSREQMGVFLGVTFNLTLYGVN
jgi:cysteine-rich repeat protein